MTLAITIISLMTSYRLQMVVLTKVMYMFGWLLNNRL